MRDIAPVRYENDKMLILDQTLLPNEEKYLEIITKEDLWEAVYELKVRGAPAIGVAAAYGLYVLTRDVKAKNFSEFFAEFRKVSQYLQTSRPTAVNLFWALSRMEKALIEIEKKIEFEENHCNPACLEEADGKRNQGKDSTDYNKWQLKLEIIKKELLKEAEKIRMEDEEGCRKMGEYGLTLLKPNMGILTHCNAGTIATAKYGTCLAPIYLGTEKGYNFKVFADETRPLLQGARLTAWELKEADIDVTLICDNMANQVMKNGWIQAVVVGCDRMAANGDGANKIGTSGVAVLAKEYKIPFYMYVPISTVDFSTATGEDIEIEERNGEEIYKMWYKKPMAPLGIKTFNPAFDVTPAKYITAVITEKGIAYPPYEKSLLELCDMNKHRE